MKRSLKIKVCGMAYPENVEEVCTLEPDYVGYIFFQGSRRYVGDRPDRSIFSIPGREIGKIGVFVNEAITTVKQIQSRYGLDLVQLHGTESPEYCRTLKNEGIPVIKALKPYPTLDDRHIHDFKDHVDYLLFDTPGQEHGGTGRKFDWNYLDGADVPLPFFLSGGIGPDDKDAVAGIKHNQLLGIDVNSRFEIAPGMKHIGLLRQFIREIRA